MNIEITDPIGAIVLLAIVLLVSWLLVYTAVITALADRLPGPVSIVAAARPQGSRVVLTLTNGGSRPAYQVRLTVGTSNRVGLLGRDIALVPILAPGVPILIEVERAELGIEPDAALPTILRAGWSKSRFPGASVAFDDVPVVVGQPETEAPIDGA